ncbi:MAG: hypothetical protein IJA45_03400 [Oscillospiraceae bacterium]|nr:hypothetical protein [Oscillospiraceae bacterium]
MAGSHDGRVTLSTKLDTSGIQAGAKGIKSALAVSTKAVAALGAAAATAIVAVTKKSVDAYAAYEQLAGGVETLFKQSADKVKAYAEDAYKTAGVSANAYMEAVTSFSASLISSLGGDTEKAAEVANMAMVDMSDNANKMGTPLANIQNAYQGFAKQNYTMLDNLKLGYGGTKTEMERLLKDAEAFSGVKYNINNLSDVYEAIHQIQVKLDVAGTTAKEAESTITGSITMTKSAWENLLTAMSGGGSLDRAIDDFVYSLEKAMQNILPVVERSLVGIGYAIERLAPKLVERIAVALIKAIPSLLNAVYKMIIGLAQGVYQGIRALFAGGTVEVLEEQAEQIRASVENQEALTEEVKETEKVAKKALAGFDELNVLSHGSAGAADSSVGAVATGDVSVGNISVGGEVKDEVTNEVQGVIDNILSKIQGLEESISTAFQPTISSWGKAFSSLVPAVKDTASRIGGAWTNLWDTSLAPFGRKIITEWVPSIANTFSETFAPMFADVMPVAMDAWTTDFENGCIVVQEATGWLTTAFEGVKTVFSDMCMSISTNWEIYGGDLLQGFTDFKDGLWETWWYIYDNIINPVIAACSETLTWLWDEHLKPLWDDVVEFVMSVSENILALWNGFLKPVIDWIIAFLAPAVTNVINLIVDWVGYAVALIADVVDGIITFLDGIIQFIVGVFTLDWERAWGGIVKMFEGVWNGVVGIVKGVVNSVIWVVNALIAALYSGIAGVVNGVGSIVKSFGELLGKDNWGFSMPTQTPKIPYLAEGAVLPANKPFLAVVGDQKHGTNIEAPLSTIQEAVRAELGAAESAILTSAEVLLEEIQRLRKVVEGIEVGDTTIGQAANRYNREMAIIKGVL